MTDGPENHQPAAVRNTDRMGARIAGAHSQRAGGRRESDWYPTPPECVVALLDRWPVAGTVWEPMAGNGCLVAAMKARGLDVVATDLYDRGTDVLVLEDFLTVETRRADVIVTNPPFLIAAEVIEHAHRLGVSRMALLLKSTYWHAAKRSPLFDAYPPRWIFPLQWRPDFTGQGGATMDVSWNVWDAADVGNVDPENPDLLPLPEYEPITRPKP